MADAPHRLVVVEDDDDWVLLASLLLNGDPRFELVGTSRGGELALELIDRTQPDVVLLDVGLPYRSGLDLLPEIRDRAPVATIITWSARLRHEFPAPPTRLGARGHLDKAFRPALLPDLLHDAVVNGTTHRPRLVASEVSHPVA